tara:strand:+ start:700 stop:1359 length:660 start_codon:yes stop_codon:yes gene_type:complete
MDTKQINSEVSKKIDNLKYTDFVEYKEKQHKISDKITIDWKGVLPVPESNTSKQTIKELRYLAEVTKKIGPAQERLIDLVDSEPLDLFKPILQQNNLDFDESVFKKIWAITEPVIMSLKQIYDRPRPYQLAGFYDLEIKVRESKTHHTPAYPSGHTAYAGMAALLLDDLYPHLGGEFFKQVGVAGYARILQGVHYPSDNRASMVITGALWEDIRKHFIT